MRVGNASPEAQHAADFVTDSNRDEGFGPAESVMKPIAVAPSILAADLRRRGEEVRAVDEAGADWIHIEVTKP